jgi:hypothetical protein
MHFGQHGSPAVQLRTLALANQNVESPLEFSRKLSPPAFEECSLPVDGCAPTGPPWPSIGAPMKRRPLPRLPRRHHRSKEAVERQTTRTLAMVVLGLVLSTRALQGQDGSRYRDHQLVGGDVPSVSALASVAPFDAKAIHQLPAVIRELEWRPPHFVSGSPALQNDPVQQIVFSFSTDQVSKMAVDSDRGRPAGMADADVIDVRSAAYGPLLLKPAGQNTRTGTSQVEKGILPWGLRRAGAGVRLTVSGVDISIQRNGFTLSKSVTF